MNRPDGVYFAACYRQWVGPASKLKSQAVNLMTLRGVFSIALMLTAYGTANTSFAYEFENGVPLTLGFQLGESTVEDVQLRIAGHDVEVAISLSNGSKQTQYAGFYASTPLFGYLGEGEQNSDKTFAELKAFHDGKPVQVSREQRGYFLGKDITHLLRKAGIGPIYSNEIDWKKLKKLPQQQNIRIDYWQSQVAFGWSAPIAPQSTAVETIRYTALPKFSLEMIDGESFAQVVQQHCGSPDKLKDMIQQAAPQETQVHAEVFELPLPFLALQSASVTIEKPTKKTPGGRRFAALACGFDGAMIVPSKGLVRGARYSISILVVSLLTEAND